MNIEKTRIISCLKVGFVAALVASGGCGPSDPDEDSDLPVDALSALIAAPENAVVGVEVTLDGSGSSGGVEPLAFAWHLDTGPDGCPMTTDDIVGNTEPVASAIFDMEGGYEIRLEVTDVEGRTASASVWISASFEDTVAPIVTVFTINDGASVTSSVDVQLTMVVSDEGGSGMQDMRFSNDSGSTWGDWQPYAETAEWSLLEGDGTKTVTAEFRDQSSNVAHADASIELDTGEPNDEWTAEDWARALIAGEVSTSEAFDAINWLEGFPVHTSSGTIIFLHWYDGPHTWAVAGGFNDWQMQEMNGQSDFWWLEVSIADLTDIGYKFVRRDIDAWYSDPFARAYGSDGFGGEISYVAPPDHAHLQRWHGVQSGDLQRRLMRVYVPGGAGPWPVLYMHDGQNLSGGWRMQEALGNLDTEILVVGIDNTSDRMNEYTHVDDSIDGTTYTAKGTQYAALIEEVVRPHIEASFPTTGLRGLMGSSLGGLISLYIAHLYPQTYHFVGSLSGTLGWGRFGLDGPIMQELYMDAGHRDFVIYVDSGGGPGDEGCVDLDGDGLIDGKSPDNYCHNVAFAEAMDDIGYTFLQDLFHWWEPDATHDEAAWAARVSRPLGIFASMAAE